MMRGPNVSFGVPKAVLPVSCGTRQGVPAIPQTTDELERANCVDRAALMLVRLKLLYRLTLMFTSWLFQFQPPDFGQRAGNKRSSIHGLLLKL